MQLLGEHIGNPKNSNAFVFTHLKGLENPNLLSCGRPYMGGIYIHISPRICAYFIRVYRCFGERLREELKGSPGHLKSITPGLTG